MSYEIILFIIILIVVYVFIQWYYTKEPIEPMNNMNKSNNDEKFVYIADLTKSINGQILPFFCCGVILLC